MSGKQLLALFVSLWKVCGCPDVTFVPLSPYSTKPEFFPSELPEKAFSLGNFVLVEGSLGVDWKTGLPSAF